MKNEIAVVVLSQILTDLRLSVLTNLLCGAAVSSESRAEQNGVGQGRVKVPEDATPIMSPLQYSPVALNKHSRSIRSTAIIVCNAESICTLHRCPSEVIS